MKPIPYGRQNITDEDIQSVTRVLKSDFLTQGPEISAFEREFATYVGAKYAVAVSNGTAALHLGALALNVIKGDKIITTPITFAASANCIQYCGGEIVFADIDPETYLLDISKVKTLLESASSGTYKGIITVDFAGRSVNMEIWRSIAEEYNLWILEDACHAPGGYFRDSHGIDQKCGNGKYSDISIFSFHPVKHIATGEGGMITTNNEDLYKKLLKLRTHGITRNESDFENSIDEAIGGEFISESTWPGWYMEMQDLGYNYRMTDFQAALGSSQLGRANHGLSRRRALALRYYEELKEIDQITDRNHEARDEDLCGHAYHLYVIEAENRIGLYNFLKSNKVHVQVHYIPLYIMPYYKSRGEISGDFPNAESYYSGCLSLPMFPTLTNAEQDFVISLIKDFYN